MVLPEYYDTLDYNSIICSEVSCSLGAYLHFSFKYVFRGWHLELEIALVVGPCLPMAEMDGLLN